MFDFADLRLPIVQAPMAGGPNAPALVAAVGTAGGLGSFGFAYSAPEKIVSELQATRRLSAAPLNANFFVFSPVELPPAAHCDAALDALSALPGAANLALSLPWAPFYPELATQLEAVWQEKPEVLTFHFGLPPLGVIERAQEAGICVGISATCLDEARRIEAAGADFVIAQGSEAGGHRGIFDIDGSDESLSTFDLLAALVGNIGIPLVAAGGIMNGAHVARARRAGAAAAQMGTAFLCCAESGATQTHRRYLLQAHDRGTAQTLAWSGRPARSVKTEFMELMNDQPTLPFPLQNSVTRTIRQAADERGDGEYQSLWAGSNYSMCRAGSTAQLMHALASELAEHEGRRNENSHMKWQGNRESSNVEDRRGGGGFGGGGFRIGGGGGFSLGTIAVVLVGGWLLGINPLTLLSMLSGESTSLQQSQPAQQPPAGDTKAQFVSVVLADTEDVWTKIFASRGKQYQDPKLVLFRGSTPTPCGTGQAAMGPFYCPADEKVYIDLGFYDILRTRLGAPGDFAQAYVIAHEVGHHVQEQLGITAQVQQMRGRLSADASNQLSVRVELQADCFAGVWAKHANDERHILEQGDIEQAMNAAAQIGDDTLQKRSQGYAVPDSFTHGTSKQRVNWFTRGVQSGDLQQCDTFNARSL